MPKKRISKSRRSTKGLLRRKLKRSLNKKEFRAGGKFGTVHSGSNNPNNPLIHEIRSKSISRNNKYYKACKDAQVKYLHNGTVFPNFLRIREDGNTFDISCENFIKHGHFNDGL